jgi:hypothetical protein
MTIDLHSLVALLPPKIAPSAAKLGLVLPADLPRETWSQLAGRLAQASGAGANRIETLTAWLGDLLAHGERNHRGHISELATVAGLSPATLRNAKLVCSRIPVSCRRDSLPWAHHCEVGKAFESLEEIGRWLDIAATEKLSKAQLRKRIREYKKGLRGGVSREPGIDVGTFALLRDLRVTDRLVSTQHDIWQRWSPETCRAALQEIEQLAEFVGKLTQRAEKPAA